MQSSWSLPGVVIDKQPPENSVLQTRGVGKDLLGPQAEVELASAFAVFRAARACEDSSVWACKIDPLTPKQRANGDRHPGCSPVDSRGPEPHGSRGDSTGLTPICFLQFEGGRSMVSQDPTKGGYDAKPLCWAVVSTLARLAISTVLRVGWLGERQLTNIAIVPRLDPSPISIPVMSHRWNARRVQMVTKFLRRKKTCVPHSVEIWIARFPTVSGVALEAWEHSLEIKLRRPKKTGSGSREMGRK